MTNRTKKHFHEFKERYGGLFEVGFLFIFLLLTLFIYRGSISQGYVDIEVHDQVTKEKIVEQLKQEKIPFRIGLKSKLIKIPKFEHSRVLNHIVKNIKTLQDSPHPIQGGF